MQQSFAKRQENPQRKKKKKKKTLPLPHFTVIASCLQGSLLLKAFTTSVDRVVDPACLGASKVKHVYRHAVGKHQSRISASVHNGRVGKNGGDGNQSALLGELGVSLHTTDPESERKRSHEKEDERDEK